jgi:TatD DNase family protein
MLFNIHTHKNNDQEDVLEIVNQYPNEFDATVKYFSIGIHPWNIMQNVLEEHLIIIEEKIQYPNCMALGECGLDKRIDTPLEIQIQVFEKQILLAKKYKKPLILHCVSAYQEVIEIKKRLNIEVPIIIHGFSKNNQIAKSLMDNGFYLSFGKYLFQNPELASVFKSIPNDRFFLETDTINETIFEVYEKAAFIKEIEVKKMEVIVSENMERVFKKTFKI